MSSGRNSEFFETIIIGGGQAGLTIGYHLARRGIPFLILEANRRIGDSWRNRWDSLRLFTPARYDALPGMKFPAAGGDFPTKDQMADYLEAYARRWDLPVRTGVLVDRLSRVGDRFLIEAGSQRFEANEVVVAMANYQTPRIPDFAPELDAGVLQLHANDYKRPAQLRDGSVLVVGLGNSGADIAMEVAETHQTFLAGTESGVIPWRIDGVFGRNVMGRVMRFVGHRVFSIDTPIGRKARPAMLHRAAPLIRVKPQDLIAAGIERVGRVDGVRDGQPLLADGRALDVANVIWCTGFQPGFSWIDLPIFDAQGDPNHHSGIVEMLPGLYFVGLHFLHSMTSATITGVERDAKRVVKVIRSRVAQQGSSRGVRVASARRAHHAATAVGAGGPAQP